MDGIHDCYLIPIGSKKEMDKFYSLTAKKNLSKDDLTVILQAVTVDRESIHELTSIKNELQDIRTILKLIQAEIKAMNETAVNQLADSLEKAVHDMPSA